MPARKITKCNDTISLSHGTVIGLETDLSPSLGQQVQHVTRI